MCLIVVLYLTCLATLVVQGADYTYSSQQAQDTAAYFPQLYQDYKTSWANKLAVIRHNSQANYYMDKLKATMSNAESLGKSDCLTVSHEAFDQGETVLDVTVQNCNDNIPREYEQELKDELDYVYQCIQTLDLEVQSKRDQCNGDQVCLAQVDVFADKEFADLKKTAAAETTRVADLVLNENLYSVTPCIDTGTDELTRKAKKSIKEINQCVGEEDTE